MRSFQTGSKETGKLADHLNKIAQLNTLWIDKPGTTIFKNYLSALSQLYSATDTKKAVEHQKTVSDLYKQLVESDFPILLVPALEGYIKEPYLDPELRVCLATPDSKKEEDAFKQIPSAMADSVAELGLNEFSEPVRHKTIRSVIAIGSCGVNLIFNAVAQEDPTTLLFLNEQIRAFDQNFPAFLEIIQETKDKFGSIAGEAERVGQMQVMSRADTIFHELTHNIFPAESKEANHFGNGRAGTIMDEVHAEILYRPLIPSLLGKNALKGTKEQWVISTLASSLQVLRDNPPGDPYYHAAVFPLNDLFEKGIVALENDKITIRDFENFWSVLRQSAQEVIALYRDETMTEAKALRWIKERCIPNKQVQQVKEFLEGIIDKKGSA